MPRSKGAELEVRDRLRLSLTPPSVTTIYVTTTWHAGGSVTIPLKEKLMDHPSISLSASAKAIGSLNTLTVMPDGTLAAE